MEPRSELAGQRKTVLSGTHRVRAPEATLSWIKPLLPRMGITRLADVTWLDDIGIPVYQAVRPNSYLLSVAQGKGLSPVLAQVSAAMEAIETWHAERLRPGDRKPVSVIAPSLGYDLRELPLVRRHHLNPAAVPEWSAARELLSGTETVVPTECLRLDGRTADRWDPRLFQSTSNGLASGNTVEEATVHGLYEVIERDAAARAVHSPRPVLVDVDTVDGASGALVEQLARAAVDLRIDLLPSPTGLPCFRARMVSDSFPVVCEGMGCHLDRDVALCRALTEAAQSRVTSIAGVRDDMPGDWYRRADDVVAGRSTAPDLDLGYRDADTVHYPEVGSITHASLAEDLRFTGLRVRAATGREPLVVDHTRPDLGVPVVRVICPGLLLDSTVA